METDTLHEQISHFYFLLTQSDTVKCVSDSTLLVKNSYLDQKLLKTTTTNTLPDFCNSDSCFLCVFSNLYTWLNHCVLFVPCDSLSGTVGIALLKCSCHRYTRSFTKFQYYSGMDLYIENFPDAVGLFYFVLVIELTSAGRRAWRSFRREA